MRLKKGFTLAEILIVLMVIGVIATMTVPSMMKGVTESQLKAGYKKGFNTIANFTAMERVAGSLPGSADDVARVMLLNGMHSSLSVKSYANFAINAKYPMPSDTAMFSCVTVSSSGTGIAGVKQIGLKTGTGDSASKCATFTAGEKDDKGGIISGKATNLWLITDDNIAYSVLAGGQTTKCLTKTEITNSKNDAEAAKNSCAVVVVDVNGLNKGPNVMETQGVASDLAAGTNYTTIVGDQFKIYVGNDGATAGPIKTTLTGRMMGDVK